MDLNRYNIRVFEASIWRLKGSIATLICLFLLNILEIVIVVLLSLKETHKKK